MHVYTTRFEGCQAYSTARKAVESFLNCGYYADLSVYESEQRDGRIYITKNVEVIVPITVENVAQIITHINKSGRVDIMFKAYYGHGDADEICKTRVQ